MKKAMTKKTTHNSKATKTAKKPVAVKDGIARLNELYGEVLAAYDELQKAYGADRRVHNARVKYAEAATKFDHFKDSLEPVQFDQNKGEYFLSKRNGKTVFRIRCCVTDTYDVEVEANDYESAKLKVQALLAANKLSPSSTDYEYSDCAR